MRTVSIIYSTYEAKARFSEVLRLVRSGTPVTVSHRGEPVAEIRPIEQQPQTITERLEELERRGILVRSREPRKPLTAAARKVVRWIGFLPSVTGEHRIRRYVSAWIKSGEETGARTAFHGCCRRISWTELRAAFAREQHEFEVDVLSRIDWILPDRPLAGEFARALEAGYLRGADLWHVATALYVAPKPAEIGFVTRRLSAT